MKNLKKLLITTALTSMVASAAFADGPSVKVGGMTAFEAGIVKQKKEHEKPFASSPSHKNAKFRSYSRLSVMVDGKAENNIKYGANIKLDQSSTEDYDKFTGGKAEKSYLYIESDMGRMEMGGNYDVARLMKVDAMSFGAGTGGAASGNWHEYANVPYYSIATPVIVKGDNVVVRDGYGAARKLSWMSPRYSGFQLGASYAPDMQNIGSNAPKSGYGLDNIKNVWSTAINYVHDLDDINMAFSADYTVGKSTDAAYKNLGTYSVGAAIGKGNVTLVANYGNDGKSGRVKDQKFTSKYWTAGAIYESGPMKASLTYMKSKRGGYYAEGVTVASTSKNAGYRLTAGDKGINKVDVLSLGMNYKIASGFSTFFEASLFKVNPSAKALLEKAPAGTTNWADAAVTQNKGTVLLLGSKVSF